MNFKETVCSKQAFHFHFIDHKMILCLHLSWGNLAILWSASFISGCSDSNDSCLFSHNLLFIARMTNQQAQNWVIKGALDGYYQKDRYWSHQLLLSTSLTGDCSKPSLCLNFYLTEVSQRFLTLASNRDKVTSDYQYIRYIWIWDKTN